MSNKWPPGVQRAGAFSRLPELLSTDPQTQELLRRFLVSVAFKGDLQYLRLSDVIESSFAGKEPGALVGLDPEGTQELTLINPDDRSDQTFLSLTDTPPSYSGESGNHVRVATTEDVLEFAAPTFLELSDTPSSFSGSGGYTVKVNSGATALEFVSVAAAGAITICEMYNSATQTISSENDDIQISLDSVYNDPGSWADTVNDKIVPDEDGVYICAGTVKGAISPTTPDAAPAQIDLRLKIVMDNGRGSGDTEYGQAWQLSSVTADTTSGGHGDYIGINVVSPPFVLTASGTPSATMKIDVSDVNSQWGFTSLALSYIYFSCVKLGALAT